MANYSGLFDGVHGDGHSLLVNRPPMRGLLKVLLAKRGLFGYSKEAGGTVTANRSVIDGNLPLGGDRTINSVATVTEVSAAVMDEVADAPTVPTLVADASGNGGGTIS